MQTTSRVSDDEYLALERASERKHELVNGHIVAMAGASPRHKRARGEYPRVARSAAARQNPKVVFEVLSESTEAFDRGAKFARYRGSH